MGNASPDQSIAGAISSILKKSGASSSGQGSLEDLTSGSDGIKSILKKRHGLASNSASAASANAANAGSTDDELEQEGEFVIFEYSVFHNSSYSKIDALRINWSYKPKDQFLKFW